MRLAVEFPNVVYREGPEAVTKLASLEAKLAPAPAKVAAKSDDTQKQSDCSDCTGCEGCPGK